MSKDTRRQWPVIALLAGAVFTHSLAARAEPVEDGAAADTADANNPIADMKAVNLHNYAIGDFTGDADDGGNQVWLRVVVPVPIGPTTWLVRGSLPLNTFPVPPDGDHKTGLGDFNVFAAYLFDVANPAVSIGVGPLTTLPTATSGSLFPWA